MTATGATTALPRLPAKRPPVWAGFCGTVGAPPSASALDADLATTLGRLFGVRVEFFNVSFDQLITGITAGRYEAAMSSLTGVSAVKGRGHAAQ